MGLLEYTSEQAYAQPPELPPILGERIDLPQNGFGIDYLRREVGAEDGWFVFGQPIDVDELYLPWPGPYTQANLSSNLMFNFWHSTLSYAPAEALEATGAILEIAQAPAGQRRVLFEVPFEVWETEPWADEFVGQLQHMLVAQNDGDVFRDDRSDEGADPDNPHYTEMRHGLIGAVPVLVITRSRMARDGEGREVVTRLVELVKPDHETVGDVINELSLTERLRLTHLLLKDRVSDLEWEYVVDRANRQNMRHDHRSVQELIRQFHSSPEERRRQKAFRGMAGWLRKLVDSPHWEPIERVLFPKSVSKA